MDAYETLVIILSITLAIFLVLAIISLALFIKFMKKSQSVIEKADSVMTDIQEVSQSVKKVAMPIAAIGNIFDRFMHR